MVRKLMYFDDLGYSKSFWRLASSAGLSPPGYKGTQGTRLDLKWAMSPSFEQFQPRTFCPNLKKNECKYKIKQ